MHRSVPVSFRSEQSKQLTQPAFNRIGLRMLRIVLTGSESVGKTTLAALLARHYGVWFVPEFVREFTIQKGAAPDLSDRLAIAEGQIALEDKWRSRSRAESKPLLLFDTDLISNVVYSRHYFGDCPVAILQQAVERRADHYLLLDIDVPWVADGVRDGSDNRQEMHDLFVETLEELRAPTTAIQGSWDERARAAISRIDYLLSNST